MYINTERSAVTYNKLALKPTSHQTKEMSQLQSLPLDTVEISQKHKINTNPLHLDKGTAANTTLYVDRSTFDKIANYTTHNPDCRWSEIGVDSEKRWIVVNGQRFETPLSEAEKKATKKSQMTLLDYLQAHEKQKEDVLPKGPKDKVEFDFIQKESIASNQAHPKIINVLQNDQVMEMLKNISKATKGKISLAATL